MAQHPNWILSIFETLENTGSFKSLSDWQLQLLLNLEKAKEFCENTDIKLSPKELQVICNNIFAERCKNKKYIMALFPAESVDLQILSSL